MVYTRLYIVYGVEIIAKEIEEILNNGKDYKDDDVMFELDEDFQVYLDKKSPKLKVFKFPCCSELRHEKFILGVKCILITENIFVVKNVKSTLSVINVLGILIMGIIMLMIF
jgi:hypothetical protein